MPMVRVPDDEKARYKAALVRIAKGAASDLAAAPSEWSSTIAYFALDGAVVNGQRIDNVDNL